MASLPLVASKQCYWLKHGPANYTQSARHHPSRRLREASDPTPQWCSRLGINQARHVPGPLNRSAVGSAVPTRAIYRSDQIRIVTPTLTQNPNVRPSAAQFTTEVADTVHVTDDSELHVTDIWRNDKINPSAPIPTSSPSAPHTFTPPTSVLAGIETPMTTKMSAHNRVYSNSVPCRDLPVMPSPFRPMQTT